VAVRGGISDGRLGGVNPLACIVWCLGRLDWGSMEIVYCTSSKH
jgi:hypothetical protein